MSLLSVISKVEFQELSSIEISSEFDYLFFSIVICISATLLSSYKTFDVYSTYILYHTHYPAFF